MFERAYQAIYGSQIKIIEDLRRLGPSGLVYEGVAAYYQQTRLMYPALNSYPLDQYLGFLVNSGLIEISNSSENKRICKITSFGIDFLEYIEVLNYTKDKLF